MKVTDERREVETDDVLTCDPDYHTRSLGTTAVKFTQLPTTAPACQVATRIELKRHTTGLSIASRASQSSVKDKARTLWGHAVKFVEPRPITWTPNKVCHGQLETDVPVPVISTDARTNLARQECPDEVLVST
jgi:hypothetical protein